MQANVELAHFVPLIIGQGGNAGSQAASMHMRIHTHMHVHIRIHIRIRMPRRKTMWTPH